MLIDFTRPLREQYKEELQKSPLSLNLYANHIGLRYYDFSHALSAGYREQGNVLQLEVMYMFTAVLNNVTTLNLGANELGRFTLAVVKNVFFLCL